MIYQIVIQSQYVNIIKKEFPDICINGSYGGFTTVELNIKDECDIIKLFYSGIEAGMNKLLVHSDQ